MASEPVHPIKAWRDESGKKQKFLAALVKTTAGHLSKIERWQEPCSASLAKRIAKETGLSLDQILMEKPDGKSPKE